MFTGTRERTLPTMNITIMIERGDPFSGTVRCEGRPDHTFHGWLALLGALSALLQEGQLEAPPDADGGPSAAGDDRFR
jgi:hypothetical protein